MKTSKSKTTTKGKGCEFCSKPFNKPSKAKAWACPYCGKRH